MHSQEIGYNFDYFWLYGREDSQCMFCRKAEATRKRGPSSEGDAQGIHSYLS